MHRALPLVTMATFLRSFRAHGVRAVNVGQGKPSNYKVNIMATTNTQCAPIDDVTAERITSALGMLQGAVKGWNAANKGELPAIDPRDPTTWERATKRAIVALATHHKAKRDAELSEVRDNVAALVAERLDAYNVAKAAFEAQSEDFGGMATFSDSFRITLSDLASCFTQGESAEQMPAVLIELGYTVGKRRDGTHVLVVTPATK